MKRLCIVAIAIATSVLSTASATMIRQEWHTGVGASRQAIIDFLEDLANPVPPPDLEEIQDLSSFTGTRDNYVAKFYGWVTVPATGTYQFHYSCDDYGMLYVSQDEEMANAEEVAWVDGWAAIAEWNKYPTQHSATMPLKKGQVMAVMAFFQEAGGGDNMDVGWTGPGLSQDGNDPTYLTDYITHIPPTPTKAKNPTPPVDDPDVQRDTDLAWKPGKFATTHTLTTSTTRLPLRSSPMVSRGVSLIRGVWNLVQPITGAWMKSILHRIPPSLPEKPGASPWSRGAIQWRASR